MMGVMQRVNLFKSSSQVKPERDVATLSRFGDGEGEPGLLLKLHIGFLILEVHEIHL